MYSIHVASSMCNIYSTFSKQYTGIPILYMPYNIATTTIYMPCRFNIFCWLIILHPKILGTSVFRVSYSKSCGYSQYCRVTLTRSMVLVGPIKLSQVAGKARNHTFTEFRSFFVWTNPTTSMPFLHRVSTGILRYMLIILCKFWRDFELTNTKGCSRYHWRWGSWIS